MQRTISDQFLVTEPELACDGLGFGIAKLLIREHDAPEQPIAQRGFQTRWVCPERCRGAPELRKRLPQWEVWARELE
eukprot:7621257-Alexandrium_andersonii.AAC.1